MLTVNRIQRLLNSVAAPGWDALPLATLFGPSLGPTMRSARHEDGMVLEFDLPGHAPEDFDIHAEGQRLTLEIKDSEHPGDDPQSRLRERQAHYGTAEFQLPFSVEADLTDVSYEQGVLRIAVRKPASEARRKIAVRGAESN